jgi:hypothetical protein
LSACYIFGPNFHIAAAEALLNNLHGAFAGVSARNKPLANGVPASLVSWQTIYQAREGLHENQGSDCMAGG